MDPVMKVLKGDGILTIMNWDYVPYGNARNESGRIVCQHGRTECTGNMAEVCVMDITKYDVLTYMTFAECVESTNEKLTELQKCAEKQNLDWSAIQTCMSGSQGANLINIAGKKTEKQNIPYTPYFFGHGKEIKNPSHITKIVCNLWTGTKPGCCKDTNDSPALNITRSSA